MKIKDLQFGYKENPYGEDKQWFCHMDWGSLTVLDRVTGFSDGAYEVRDIETGYRGPNNKGFWLASGNFDIREFPELTVEEAIEKVKENANTCIGDEDYKKPQPKDCMFQYATAAKTYEDTDLITMDEAKTLWNQYKPQFIEDHGEGRNPEMVIWVDCEDDESYGESLWHVDYDSVIRNDEIHNLVKQG